jgi:curved DNA-binding protein CbpA
MAANSARAEPGEDLVRDLLGVPPGAGGPEIKKRYYRLARENHPDFFPPEAKAIQEMKMMALNEAYAWLAALPEKKPASAPEAAPAAGPAPGALALPRDPAYVYYKQGFLNFSRALHGIAALSRAAGAGNLPGSLEPDRLSLRRFADSLLLLRRAHAYFRRVSEEYPDSIWRYDARIKLKRIARFSALYRRIVSNLGAKSSPSA